MILTQKKMALTTRRVKYSRAITSPLIPRQSKSLSTSRTAKLFFTNLVWPTAWLSQLTSSACSLAIFLWYLIRCVRSAGQRATHCPSMVPNTSNSARSKPAMATVMVAQCRYLRPSSKVNLGKCN